jgi:hypothetical protein
MLKRAFLAPDEFMAITIREMLKSRNIEAEVRRFETSWLDGLPKMMKGGWGEVMVHEEDLAQAQEYVEEFLAAPQLPEEPESQGPVEDRETPGTPESAEGGPE